MTLVEDVARQLEAALKSEGLNRTELATLMGVSRPYVTYLFKGRNLTLKTLEKLATTLNMEVNIELRPREVQVLQGPLNRSTESAETDAA